MTSRAHDEVANVIKKCIQHGSWCVLLTFEALRKKQMEFATICIHETLSCMLIRVASNYGKKVSVVGLPKALIVLGPLS